MRKPPTHRLLVLTALLALAACGGLPRPFEGDPGATAMRLAMPPPSRLDVPTPANALLPQAIAAQWAGAMADTLVDQEVPAVAERERRGDWRLVMSADLHGGSVTPSYTVLNPQGISQGSVTGTSIPAEAWAQGDPGMLKQVSAASAADIANLLTAIESARRESDPNSLINRPARLYIRPVTGAPGDGDVALTRQMQAQLPQIGEQVQTTAAGADYVIAGTVKSTPIAGNQTRIEIRWGVLDAAGHEAGAVTQINEIPAGQLDQYWGDVALVVTQQAAGGLKDVILNQADPRRTNPAAAAVKLPPRPGSPQPLVAQPGAAPPGTPNSSGGSSVKAAPSR